MTIHQAILYGETLLKENGVDRPRWEAEILLLLAIHRERSEIYANLTQTLSQDEFLAYENLLRKRSDHYPLAYLEGTQEFYGRTFAVNESVLIPRPETEEIIRAVLSLNLPEKPRVLDLGAGSGCISLTLAMEIPDATVFAVELSNGAIAILRQNIAGKATPVRGDLFAVPFIAASFDVVVANPPYVESSHFQELPAETRWEPREALLTENLQQTYTGILQQASHLLKPMGYLVFEIGYGQSERIQTVCDQQNKLQILQMRKDQRDVTRTFVLRKRA